MIAENHWLAQRAADESALFVARTGGYWPYDPAWSAWRYQMVGDTVAGRAVVQMVRDFSRDLPPGNETREMMTTLIILFDWVYSIATPAERTEIIAGLERSAYSFTLETGSIWRYEDFDTAVSHYFALAALDLLGRQLGFGTRWLDQRQFFGVPVGGLVATGNSGSFRNRLKYFAERSAGGDFVEGSDYGPGTSQLLILGLEAINTATTVRYFPEWDANLREMADVAVMHVTSDLNQRVQWGDEQHPRSMSGREFKNNTFRAMLSGVTKHPKLHQLVLDSWAKFGTARQYPEAYPRDRVIWFYDPYVGTTDWKQPASLFASGRGSLLVRQPGALFHGLYPEHGGDDHGVDFVGDFQLYRNGEWALTHPLGYGSRANDAATVNSVSLAGLPSAMNERVLTDSARGSDWWSVTGRTSGNFYYTGYYVPPATFLDGWTRSIVYLRRGGVDWVVTLDDVQNARDPRTLPNFDRYGEDRGYIEEMTYLVAWHIHAPVAPDITPSTVRWRTPGGQPVIVHRVNKQGASTVIDERTHWNQYSGISMDERKYQVRLDIGNGLSVHAISVGSETPASITALPDGVRFGATEVRIVNGRVTVSN